MTTTTSFSTTEFQSLCDRVRQHAVAYPDALLYRFLGNEGKPDELLTFGDLDRRARAVAAQLSSRIAPGARALLLYPPGLEFIVSFFGCLYAGVVAVPVYLPSTRAAHWRRLTAIAHDAGAAVLMVDESHVNTATAWLTDEPSLALHLLTAETGDDSGAYPVGRTASDIAFLQYTSGSTGTPKGVIVSHGNLMHNQALIEEKFGHDRSTVVVGWLPQYHDMGLIGNILQPAYLGATAILMSPQAFLQEPARWLRTISQYRATTSGGPDFAYRLCAERISDDDKAELDLSRWTLAFSGAEPVNPNTLELFHQAFRQQGFRKEVFYPCYGLAEGTLLATGARRGQLPRVHTVARNALAEDRVAPWSDGDRGTGIELVSCGDLGVEDNVLLVHPTLHRPAAGDEVGEIWLSGPSVAQGYWNNPALTQRDFQASLHDGRGPFLRTGDLGFVHDRQLYIAGRLKDLIIIRGRNYYPQDIEAALQEALPELRKGCGTCFSVHQAEEEKLVVVQELERTALRRADLRLLWEQARQIVAEQFGVQLYQLVLVKPGVVPKTSSGKVRRRACKDSLADASLDCHAVFIEGGASNANDGHDGDAAPLTAQRSAVLDLLARSLRQPERRFGSSMTLGACGLDSLAAAELSASLQSEMGVQIDMIALLDGMTVAELLEQAESTGSAIGPVMQPEPDNAAADKDVPASWNARAIWQMEAMYPACSNFRLGVALQISGPLDTALFAQAVAQLPGRHPVLAVRFEEQDGKLRAVSDNVVPGVSLIDASGWTPAQLQQTLDREQAGSLDPAAGPPWRIALYRRAPAAHILHLSIHHILVDAWSLQVLVADLAESYAALARGQALPTSRPARHGANAAEQSTWLHSEAGRAALLRYRATLADLPGIVDLPTDFPRPREFGFRGGDVDLRLDASLTRAVRQHATAHGATLFTWLLAAWQVMLYRYTGQDAFLLGAPVSERNALTDRDTVNCFVDMKLFGCRVQGNRTFSDHLAATRANVLEVLHCLRVPTQAALEGSNRSNAWPSAVFPNVRFALLQDQRLPGCAPFLLSLPDASMPLGDWTLAPQAIASTSTAADLALTVLVDNDHLHCRINYNGELFTSERIVQLGHMFKHLLASICDSPALAVQALQLQAPAQAMRELARAAGPHGDYGPDVAVHQLFEEHVRRTPSATAVICGDRHCSYAELDARAELIAAHLRAKAPGPEPRVGLYMSRSIDMVAAFLGALKAGACCVMLEPSLPTGRINYIVRNSRMSLVMTDGASAAGIANAGVPSLDVGILEAVSGTPPSTPVSADHAAYIIYTSGSTGEPKGVVGLHRGIANRTRWMIRHFGLTPDDRVLHTTPIGFVRAEREILFPLSAGATLVVLPSAGLNDPDAIVRLLAEQRISFTASSPSLLRMMLDQNRAELTGLLHLRRWFIGADVLKPALVREIQQALPTLKLTYFYGSTEVSSDVAHYDIEDSFSTTALTTPIGTPLSNTTVYVLDQHGSPAPEGIPGQLYIGGVQLARGYFGHPMLTAEKFIPDPFSAIPGSRMYASGDFAYRRPDGNLVIIGRNDDQVKIHGHRIELGEIEHAVRAFPEVADVVVLVQHKNTEHPLIVAYVVAKGALPASRLRSHLEARLPSYMIPAVFLQLPRLPVTTLGKLDRAALLTLPLDLPASDATPAEDALQAGMAQTLADLLGLPVSRIGIDTNFLELGANSALMSKFVARLRDAHPESRLRLADVYKHHTVRRLAEAVSGSRQPASGNFASATDRAALRRNAVRRQPPTPT